jgi:hypothetical protein
MHLSIKMRSAIYLTRYCEICITVFINTCKLHNYNVFLQTILLNFFMHV